MGTLSYEPFELLNLLASRYVSGEFPSPYVTLSKLIQTPKSPGLWYVPPSLVNSERVILFYLAAIVVRPRFDILRRSSVHLEGRVELAKMVVPHDAVCRSGVRRYPSRS